MSFLAATAIAGGALSLYGTISAANAQADAVEQNAALKRQQADELLARQKINEAIIRDQAERKGLLFGAAFSSTGREGGGIGGILQIHRDAEENILNTRRDAEFKARMLRSGADIDTQLASEGVKAAWISGIGGILSTGASSYSMMRGPTTPGSLPEVQN